MPRYADVIINISAKELDRPFTYIVPEAFCDKVNVGSPVLVPFGTSNRKIRGYVIAVSDVCALDDSKLKSVVEIDSRQQDIQGQFISLACRMKNMYGSTMNQALKTVIPVKSKVKPKTKTYIKASPNLQNFKSELEACRGKQKFKARERLLEALLETPVMEKKFVKEKLNISDSTINSLRDKGVIDVYEEVSLRNPGFNFEQRYKDVSLNDEQQSAVDNIWQDYTGTGKHTWLLHGITGSGKTEVYLELIDRVLDQKKQVIVLIPEISLTYQTLMRFYRKFGNRVSVVNSKMSMGERYDQFLRAKNGEIDIMIGPRSALFTPFENLGMIVIDEEHEDSYKSETAPRYDARQVAAWRCEMTGSLLLLGSATPSIESYYKAEQGIYRMCTLKKRGDDKSFLPGVSVVDMRQELAEGNRSILSRLLYEKIRLRLLKHEQIMLFLNRRGYSNFLSCRRCGEAVKCPHCDVSLTLHEDGILRCHYCGYQERAPRCCPACGSAYLAGFGMGTQKAAAMIGAQFPDARIIRMDADTVSKKGGYEEILEKFSTHAADILIGTQMIVKGHDFKNVTLVGILAADKSLYSSTYRASEKTFQLLTQAAGRAGRGELPGDVVIQTYRPEHFAIRTAAAQNYEKFYDSEIRYRKRLGYPPCRNMLSVLLTSPDEVILDRECRRIAGLISEAGKGDVCVNGPAKDTIGKINDQFRQVIFAYSNNINILIDIQKKIEKLITMDKQGLVVVNLDLN